jgi:hypothetical protein
LAILVKANGSQSEVEPRDPEKGFTLEELYKMLECDCIQVVETDFPSLVMIIDEEGKLKTNRVNWKATAIFPGRHHNDMIVGHALICRHHEFK